MIAQQRKQESLANNIANANTPGYKADNAVLRSFPELLMQEMGNNHILTTRGLNIRTQQQIEALNTGVYVQETIPDFSQGPLKETGIATDFALVSGTLPNETGSLFFTFQTEAGVTETGYTRDDAFYLSPSANNESLMLTSADGHPVLGQYGPIIIAAGFDGISIQPTGQITVQRGN